MSARFSLLLAPFCLLLAVGSCTDVVLVEESEVACKNGKDDDGNGLTDCADPSCDGSGVCEGTSISCENGKDDDDDGLTDCEQPSCVEGGFCDSFVAECEVLPQDGCPVGMGCYRRGKSDTEFEVRCRVAGRGKLGAYCDIRDIDALAPEEAHPCAEGFGCFAASTVGACGNYCASDADCSTGGLCYPRDPKGAAGLCTAPCDPRIADTCGSGLDCVSLHERGEAYETGGARWACADEALGRGLAGLGETCEDAPTPSTPSEKVCSSAYACVPDGASATCRELCDVADPACTAGTTCERLYPSGAPSGVGNKVFGVCL